MNRKHMIIGNNAPTIFHLEMDGIEAVAMDILWVQIFGAMTIQIIGWSMKVERIKTEHAMRLISQFE